MGASTPSLQPRSQFVFTEPYATRKNGRSMIVWQTARTVGALGPGQRGPVRRASGLRTIAIGVETRERYPYRIAGRGVETVRSALPCRDYAVRGPAIGCWPPSGASRSRTSSSRLSMDRWPSLWRTLSSLPAAAVVVQARYSQLLVAPRVPRPRRGRHRDGVLGLVARGAAAAGRRWPAAHAQRCACRNAGRPPCHLRPTSWQKRGWRDGGSAAGTQSDATSLSNHCRVPFGRRQELVLERRGVSSRATRPTEPSVAGRTPTGKSGPGRVVGRSELAP